MSVFNYTLLFYKCYFKCYFIFFKRARCSLYICSVNIKLVIKVNFYLSEAPLSRTTLPINRPIIPFGIMMIPGLQICLQYLELKAQLSLLEYI